MALTLINADLSQAELRVMACESQDKWMIDALQEGVGDFFDYNLMPVAYPSTVAEYESIDNFKAAEPTQHKELRTNVKGVVYGLSFDRQAPAIAKALKMPTMEAQKIIDNFLSAAFDFAQWRANIRAAAITPSKREMLVNRFGRKFQSEIITSKNFDKVQREALAFIPQSTASDICLSTAIRIAKPLRDSGYNIFNVVHDAIMVEGEEDGADHVGEFIMQELRATGEAVYGTTVPFLSDFSIGPSWSDLS
jgi:DNA polymerase I-like protein with 3'-5' exonuclease and polymerase domains